MVRRHRLVFGIGLIVALMMTTIFTVRAFHQLSRIRSRADEPIRPWMTVPYIARSYGVPPPVLFEALDLQPGPDALRPIGRIAKAQNRPVEAVINTLMDAIEDYRLPEPPDPPEPPELPRDAP